MEQLNYRAILTRRAEWEGDVLHVHDMIRDVLNGVEQEIESSVLNHFSMDFTDLRGYLRDKEAWSRKQAEDVPKWIPVTERLPEKLKPVLVWQPIYTNLYIGLWDGTDWWIYGGMGIKEFGITHWKSLPEPPKEEDNAEGH